MRLQRPLLCPIPEYAYPGAIDGAPLFRRPCTPADRLGWTLFVILILDA